MERKRLSRDQVLALGRLVKQPELFEAIESIFVDMQHNAMRDYESAKEALVFSDTARPTAHIAYGRLQTLGEVLDLFNRQKI